MMNKIVGGLIGYLILWSIFNFVVKPLVEGDKTKKNSIEKIETFKKKFRPKKCKGFNLNKQECKNFIETGELPKIKFKDFKLK